jgi:cytochrome c oxidase subunit 2
MTLLTRFTAFLTVAFMSVPAFAQEAETAAAAEAPFDGSVAQAGGALIGQPTPWGIGLQPGVTPVKEQVHFFHNALLLPIITAITLLVLLLLIFVVMRFRARRNPTPSRTTHNTMLEVVWTLVPVLLLVLIVVPSMKMLYFMDRTHNPEMTLKVTGYQWYWGYEYPDHGGVAFDAMMVPTAELQEGQPRLLATDREVVLPVDTDIRILVTANDVIHAWAVPAFGVKTDAIPGRTNETWVRIEREGVYYGQCSEICGNGHAYMPIQVRAVSKEDFAAWVASEGGSMPAPGTEGAAVDAAAGPADARTAEEQPAEVTGEQEPAEIPAPTTGGEAREGATINPSEVKPPADEPEAAPAPAEETPAEEAPGADAARE